MFPSKADRILSRYRPIAPKPLPPPPLSSSLATDLSSTCASLDSFASSSKGRRTRKRRAAPANLPSGKSSDKLPKLEMSQALPAISNNAGACASSVTEGNSDAIVPRCDSRSITHVPQWPFGNFPCSDLRAPASMATGISQSLIPSQGTTLSIPAPPAIADSIVEKARSYMVADTLKSSQQPVVPYSLMQGNGNPIFLNGFMGGSMEKDADVMERVAAKGPGQGGGGFTEMIRGITRLSTAADVQTLMQTKSASSMALAPELVESYPGQQTTACSQVVRQNLPVLHPPFPELLVKLWEPAVQEDGLERSALPRNVDGTLPLLPTATSKHPTVGHAQVETRNFLRAEVPLFGACSSGEDQPSAVLSIGSCSPRQIGMLGCTEKTGNWVDHGESSLASSMKSLSGCGRLSSVASTVPSLGHDRIGIDHRYLEQIYGTSTDPVLLLDQYNQALWSNKAYDRALKSASDRLCHKSAPTGPYIDPLGHPTRLGSFVLNVPSKPASVTLWGFLKKLVMPEAEATPPVVTGEAFTWDHSREGQAVGALRLSLGEMCGPAVCNSRLDSSGLGCLGRLTMVTLESITEVHIEEDAAVMGSLEVVEARLGATGSAPAFITDCTSRVMWVNSAFKQMLGSAESCRSANEEGMKVTFLHEPSDLTFVGSVDKLPHKAWAFSGRVNLEWMKSGKRRSMTVPCDVSRLVTAAVWVWKFDLALSLSLNLSV